jgi:hypothetical protein
MKIDEYGRMLYGDNWQTPTAKALGVTKMTVWRWHTQQGGAVPSRYWDAAQAHAVDRMTQLQSAANLSTREMAAAVWPYGTRARMAELVSVSPATLSRYADWSSWHRHIDAARQLQIQEIREALNG